MRVLQINACYSDGSTGANTRDIHRWLLARGEESFVAVPGFQRQKESGFYAIGNPFDRRVHAFVSRITGYQAYGSAGATRALCRYIDKIAPDVIHLQNVHSHFLHLPLLLRFIAKRKGALCLTLHDCWFFTGRCVHYTESGCARWQIGCGRCPKNYHGIKTWFFDRSAEMARTRQSLFVEIDRLGVIGVSDWVLNQARQSYILGSHPTARWRRLYNWVDDKVFKPTDSAPLRSTLGIPEGGKMILGVSSPWSDRKGLSLFLDIAPLLAPNEKIVLVGPLPARTLPANIVTVGKVGDPTLLARYYGAADLFVQGSREETFGKVTAESLLCGTPAAVVDSTGNTELIHPGCGLLIPPRASAAEVLASLRATMALPKPVDICRADAQARFTPEKILPAHFEFYASLL